MRLRTRVFLQLAALFLLGALSFAADDAYLYIVHGVPGRDISDIVNPSLPIDVLFAGDCVVRGLAFASISGPLSFSAGTYDVEISEANTLAPCTNLALISSQVTLTSGKSVSAVAAISKGEPALLQFVDNLAPVVPGNARFVLVQAADAAALQATLTERNVTNPKTFTLKANPDTQQWIGIPYGTYLVEITAVGNTTVLASEQIVMTDQSVALAYAAGEAANNSVGLVYRIVDDVF
jgi:hypothetical protein